MLETTELARKLTADIELHMLGSDMTQDPELKDLLLRHVRAMETTYRHAVSLLQNKGASLTSAAVYQADLNAHPHVGLGQQSMIPAPNTFNARRLSDVTICTLALNSHKAGSMFGMAWANECVDPDVRALHVTSANNCQQMAYEIWQYMNARGFYQAPAMPAEMARNLAYTFQPAALNNDLPYTGVRHLI